MKSERNQLTTRGCQQSGGTSNTVLKRKSQISKQIRRELEVSKRALGHFCDGRIFNGKVSVINMSDEKMSRCQQKLH